MTSSSGVSYDLQPIHIPHSSSSMSAGGLGGMGGGCPGGDGVVAGGANPLGGVGMGMLGGGRGRPLNLKMKFVCGQCWREGQVNEPDKNLKYCTAKARHRYRRFTDVSSPSHLLAFIWLHVCFLSWTKERRVLLVKSFEKKKWVVVRPLPFSRSYPQQYDVSSCSLGQTSV